MTALAERFDAATHPFWHGSASMSFILDRAGPDDMWVRGEGSWLIDASGRKYLDARAGIGNVMLGYSREDIVETMYRQLRELPFATSMRWERVTPIAVECARALVDVAPDSLTRARFTHTGSSAVEAAVLVARSYQRNRGKPDKRLVVGLRDSYHGSTMASMAASGQRVLHWFFGPMPGDFVHVAEPRPDTCSACSTGEEGATADCADALRRSLEELDLTRVAALVLEPVKGRNGVPLPDHFLRAARDVCDANDVVLIFDEVLTGFGRMGAMFAAELSGVTPDVMCLAKGLTAGYAALGAVLVTDEIYDVFNASDGAYFAHASSTDAHPVACAAALATTQAFVVENVVAAGRRAGELLAAATHDRLSGSPLYAGIRSQGAYVAVALLEPGGRPASMEMKRYLEAACMERGVLIDYTPDTVMFTPPLTITDEEVGVAASALAEVVLDFDEDRFARATLRPPTLRGHR